MHFTHRQPVLVYFFILQCGAVFGKFPRWEYLYQGDVYAKAFSTIGATNPVSYFGIRGRIALHPVQNEKVVVQLSNFATTAYNGAEAFLELMSTWLPTTEESCVLYQPFVIYYDKDMVSYIEVQRDEPLWSVNMKKAIASMFQVHLNPSDSYNYTERNIYGTCNTLYETTELNNIMTVTKQFKKCEQEPFLTWGNVESISEPIDHNILKRSVLRKYTINRNHGKEALLEIESIANITMKTMLSDGRPQYIIQKQIFKQQNYQEVDTIFDLSRMMRKNLSYEYSIEMNRKEKNITKLVDEIKIVFKQYQEMIQSKHVNRFNFENDAIFPKLYNLISDLSYASNDFTSDLRELIKNTDFFLLWKSFLTYIGSESAASYLKDVILNNKWESIEIACFLSAFPPFVESGVELKDLEYLLYLDLDSSPLVRYTAIINFASAVDKCYRIEKCTETVVLSYVNKLNTLRIESSDYDYRIAYLLGIANMADVLSEEYILKLITDVDEYPNIRALGTYAFKYALSDTEKVFSAMWPVVHNHSETLAVRVAALDLIFSMKLSNDYLERIIQSFGRYHSDEQGQHLYNYFYTSITPLAEIPTFRKDLFDSIKSPKSYKVLSTSKYEFKHQSRNADFGSQLTARLVANPNTNYLDTFIFSSKTYGMSLNLEDFTIYLKIQGVIDDFLLKFLRKRSNSANAIEDLLSLIKNHKYIIKNTNDIDIHVVIFSQNKAILAYQTSANRIDNIVDILIHFLIPSGISYPVMHYITVPSDLGMEISYSNKLRSLTVIKEPQENNSFWRMRNENKLHVKLNYDISLNGLSIGVSNIKSFMYQITATSEREESMKLIEWTNDNISLSGTIDILVATVVQSKQLLKRFCPSCPEYYEYQMDTIMQNHEVFEGFYVNMSVSGFQPYELQDYSNRVNGSDFQNAIDLLLLRDELFYNPPVDNLHWSIRTLQYSKGTVLNKLELDSGALENDIGKYISLIYTSKILNDTVTRYWNMTSIIEYKINSTAYNKLPVHINITVENMYENNPTTKMCLNTHIRYHEPRNQVYSLIASKPTELTFTYANGTDDCKNMSVIFNIFLSLTEEQEMYATQQPEYNICKKQSEGLMFVPPTEECRKVSNILTTYRKYDLSSKIQLTDIQKSAIQNNDKSEWKDREEMTNISVVYDIEKPLLKIIDNSGVKEYKARTYFLDFFLIQSIDRSIYEEYISWGLEKNCFITPQYIKTFSEKYIQNYVEETKGEMVAFVECIDKTRAGLVFTRLDDKHLAFKLWLDESILSTTASSNSIQAVLDGTVLKTNDIVNKDSYSLFMVQDNVLFLRYKLFTFYYNTEYIMVKVYSNYASFVCGLCK